jgi:hypothetical protein
MKTPSHKIVGGKLHVDAEPQKPQPPPSSAAPSPEYRVVDGKLKIMSGDAPIDAVIPDLPATLVGSTTLVVEVKGVRETIPIRLLKGTAIVGLTERDTERLDQITEFAGI